MIKLRNKKGSETIENIFMIILFGSVIFSGLFLFWADNLSSSGQTMPSQYNETYVGLVDKQNEIKNMTEDVRDSLSALEENPNVITGVSGFYKSLLLVTKGVTTGIGTANLFIKPFDILPSWAIVFIITIIIIALVFAIMRAIGGRWNL